MSLEIAATVSLTGTTLIASLVFAKDSTKSCVALLVHSLFMLTYTFAGPDV